MATRTQTYNTTQHHYNPPFDHPSQHEDPTYHTIQPVAMNNTDPTNEFMYQIPPGQHRSDGEAIDPQALKERLQFLGLHEPSRETLTPSGEADHAGSSASSTPTTPVQDPRLLHHPNNPYFTFARDQSQAQKNPLRRYPTVHEVYPENSISMYHPRAAGKHAPIHVNRPPTMAPRRTGGTDIDPGEDVAYLQEEYANPAMSPYSAGDLTAATPRSLAYLDPTMPAESAYTRGTLGHGGMAAMRERLIAEQAQQEALKQAELAAHINETAKLAATVAKLESAEEQLRTLQATLIAERVARTQIQQSASTSEENMRDCREELASAVRALRRARDEGKRTEEDRKALAKAYEVAQAKLQKYQLEMSVREATARGRAYGRQEAWDEAARWMGVSPPIPVEPIHHIPETVLRRTPMTSQQPLSDQSYQQNHQQGHQHSSHSPPNQHHDRSQTSPSAFSPNQQQRYQPMVMPMPDSNTQTHGSRQYTSSGVSPEHAQQARGGQQQQQQQQQSHQRQQNNHAMSSSVMSPSNNHTGQGRQSSQQQSMHHPQPVQRDFNQAQQPYGGNSHSVPHQHSQLPPQQPMRAATVINQNRRHVSQPPPLAHQSSSYERQQPTHERHPEPLRTGAADSYLDRIEHDPRLQKMLSGAASRSLHTSQFPPTEGGQDAHDKPLPNPMTSHPGDRANTMHSAANTHATQNGKSRRRQSLSEGMHPGMVMSTIPDGDRYPAFPGAAPHGGLSHVGHRRGHSRSTSLNSVDPAAYALSPSAMHSTNATPQTMRYASSTARQTPQSQSARARSRMAGALRNDGDLAPAELSQIMEEDAPRVSTANVPQNQRERDFQQSAIMRNVSSKTPGPVHRAPSLPPSRHQPRPVMPGLLNKSASEYHPSAPRYPLHQQSQSVYEPQPVGPRGDDPPMSHPMYVPPHLAPMAVSGGIEDVQGPRHSALGLEGIEAQSGGVNALGHGYTGGNESLYTSQGAREESHHGGLSGLLGKMKAPTITIQPPSSRTRSNVQTQAPSAKSAHQPLPDANDLTSQQATAQTADHPTRRQTTIITEYFDDLPPPAPPAAAQSSVPAHQVPLPRSRANTVPTNAPLVPILLPASTVNNGGRAQKIVLQPHEVPLPKSRAPTVIPSPAAHQIPLPPARSAAPTAYDGTPDLLSPRTDQSTRSRKTATTKERQVEAGGGELRHMPSVSVIDYAILQPLPESRATTMFGTPKTTRVSTELEENTRRNGQSKRKPHTGQHVAPRGQTPENGGHRNGHGGNGGVHHGIDPRQVPLPASRAPTAGRTRASTYARTEGTIDEVTEEESGKENHGRKKW